MGTGACLQICLSPLHTWSYSAPVTQSSHLFLSLFPLSLKISSRDTLCSQGLCQALQQSIETTNTPISKEIPCILGIFQACKIFTAVRCSKSLQSKHILFCFVWFPPKSHTVSTWYIFTGMKKLPFIISLLDRYSPMPCRAEKGRHSMWGYETERRE